MVFAKNAPQPMMNLKCACGYLFVPEVGQALGEGQSGNVEEKQDLGHGF